MHNEVTYFMWYMFNKWCEDEAVEVFGYSLGKHIWEKWEETRYRDHTLSWYAELDVNCRNAIVKRANEIYKGV